MSATDSEVDNRETPPEICGWLMKHSRNNQIFLGNWRRRYFIVAVGRINYYKDSGKGEKRGCMRLDDASYLPTDKELELFLKHGLEGEQDMLLRFPSRRVKEEWQASIQKHIDFLKNPSSLPPSSHINPIFAARPNEPSALPSPLVKTKSLAMSLFGEFVSESEQREADQTATGASSPSVSKPIEATQKEDEDSSLKTTPKRSSVRSSVAIEMEAIRSLLIKHNANGKRLFNAVRDAEEVFQIIQEREIDINWKAEYSGETTLFRAARYGYAQTVQVLLENGADTELADSSAKTPLYEAAIAGHVDCVRLLLEKGAQTDTRNSFPTPLAAACKAHQAQCVQLLLQYNADYSLVDSEGRTPLIEAAREGQRECVVHLLEKGAVRTASHRDVEGHAAMHWAAFNGHTECIQLLCKYGADVNVLAAEGGFTPLHGAGHFSQYTCIQVLLDRGAVLEAIDNMHRTALHFAASSGSKECTLILLQAGAVVDKVDIDGNTPLALAIENENRECIDVLQVLQLRSNAS